MPWKSHNNYTPSFEASCKFCHRTWIYIFEVFIPKKKKEIVVAVGGGWGVTEYLQLDWMDDGMDGKKFTTMMSFTICNVVTPLWRSVKMTLTLSKWGLGSPSGLPKIQSSISGVKTPLLEVFFIPLERSWSVDVENDLAWAIRTSAAQVMYERTTESQIGSLTLDHKKLGIDPTPVCAGRLRHTVGKLSRRATSFF
jgi:hypothetical protein